MTWLQDVEKIKSINKQHSDDNYKRMVKKIVPKEYSISNGSFIVGALLAGFKIEIRRPSAYFNISEKSLNRKALEGDFSRRI